MRTHVTLAAGLLVGVLGVTAPSAHAALPGCSSLKGKDLMPGPARLYDKPAGGRAHRYLLCVRPSGARARELEATNRNGRLEVLDARGGTAAIRDARTRAVHVHDLVANKRRRVLRAGRNPGRVLVDEAGEAAALFGTTLVGYDLDGRSYALGAGASSLRRRRGAVVAWKQGGATRTTDLREPAVACDRLAGKRVVTTDALRVVEVEYVGSYLVGQLDGDVSRLRVCARRGAPVTRYIDEATMSRTGIPDGQIVRVEATAGTQLVWLDSYDSEGSAVQTHTRLDVATGTRTVMKGLGGLRTLVSELVLLPDGRAAGVVDTFTEDSEEADSLVLAIRPDGSEVVLDRAPFGGFDLKAFGLDGTTLRWTKKGSQPQSADLATA